MEKRQQINHLHQELKSKKKTKKKSRYDYLNFFYDIDAEFPLENHHLITVSCYWQAACFSPSRNKRRRNRIFKFDIIHVARGAFTKASLGVTPNKLFGV